MSDIYAALAAVMSDVDHVAKRDRNEHHRFTFRGIDAVVNAVGPALRRHGVIVTPLIHSVDYEQVSTSGGKPATACRIIGTYTFWAGDGSSIATSVAAEAWDNGDKATPKAMSVAFRTALLQALCLPTDEPDPDSHSYERSPQQVPHDPPMRKGEVTLNQAKEFALQAAALHEAEHDKRLALIQAELGAVPLGEATVPQILNVAAALNKSAPEKGEAA